MRKIDNIIRRLINSFTFKNKRNIDNIREINYIEVQNILKNNSDIKIIDIRSPQEFAEGRLKFAINIPLYDLRKKVEKALPNKDEIIILYCQFRL